jgi:hypothetical protein
MIQRNDRVIEDIYVKIKDIIDNIYRKKGLSSEQIKKYLSIQRNFNNFVKNFIEFKIRYDKQDRKMTFEEQIRDILFDKILMDRIYYEKDNKVEENLITNYKIYLREINFFND